MTSKVYQRGADQWRSEFQKTTYPNGTIVENRANVNYVLPYTDFVTGGYYPDWRARLKNHYNACTPMFGAHRVLTATQGYLRLEADFGAFSPGSPVVLFVDSGNCFLGGVNSSFVDPFLSYSKANARALGDFYKKARSALVKFQAGTFIGEIRETARAIRHPADALKKGISSYLSTVKKRGKGLRGLPMRKMLAGSWLEGMFGWRPLISDIYNAAEALATLTYRPDYERITTEATEDIVRFLFEEDISAFSNIWFRQTRRVVDYGTERYYGEVRIRLPEYPLNFLSENQFGLGMDDFVPTIYELIPYSFLVDYFTNLGDIVNAVSFPTANLAWVTRLTRGVCKNSATGQANETIMKAIYGASYMNSSVNPGFQEFYVKGFQRIPIPVGTLPLPSLQFNLNLGASKIANIAALIFQGHSTQRNFHL